jgi:hypothetical protein
MAAMADLALQTAPWKPVTALTSVMPVHTALLVSGADSYDAYKFCGNYTQGTQKAFAGMVAYRYRIPAEGLAGTKAKIHSIAIPVWSDRWNVSGTRIAAYISDSEFPPDVWATLRIGDAYEDGVLPMPATVDRVDSAGTCTITYASDTTVKKYLWVFVSLEDYPSARGYWIEGGAFIDGAAVVVTFNRAVTEDSPLTTIKTIPIFGDCINALTTNSAFYGATQVLTMTIGSDKVVIDGILAAAQAFSTTTKTAANPTSALTVGCSATTGSWDATGSGWYGYRYLSAERPSTVKGLYFHNAITALASIGQNVRLSIYLVAGVELLGVLDAATLNARAFWVGEATSIICATPSGTRDAVLLCAIDLTTAEIAANTRFPTALVPINGPATIILCASVIGTNGTPSAGTALTWTPSGLSVVV